MITSDSLLRHGNVSVSPTLKKMHGETQDVGFSGVDLASGRTCAVKSLHSQTPEIVGSRVIHIDDPESTR